MCVCARARRYSARFLYLNHHTAFAKSEGKGLSVEMIVPFLSLFPVTLAL